MKFGIILCTTCHRGLGFDLRFKSTKCPFCGAKLKIKPEYIKFQTGSEKDLAATISKINQHLEHNSGTETDFSDFGLNETDARSAEIEKKAAVYEQLDPIKRIAMKFKNQPESIHLVKELVVNLSLELGEFSIDDFENLLVECGIESNKCEEYIVKLKELTIIYEPKPGIYRVLDED